MVVDEKKVKDMCKRNPGGIKKGVAKYEHLIKPTYALYDAGLGAKRIAELLVASPKWVRSRLRERAKADPSFKMKSSGYVSEDANSKRVLAILRKIADEDLNPKIRKTPKRSKRKTKKRSR